MGSGFEFDTDELIDSILQRGSVYMGGHCLFKKKYFFFLEEKRLSLRNLLTWDNLISIAVVWPNICSLCMGKSELVSHIFVYCPFAIVVWDESISLL